ncbi:MAG: hypothetical protein KJO43_02935 [Phycisphaerae bacterium]|nr:hypothetical protein [Phycisphaerae bacterium]NNF41903.1 hypothetical protein [Phycisphaerales bacterium]
MDSRPHRGEGFTLLELAISLALVVALLAVLLPALATARVTSARDRCADHLHRFGGAWTMYLQDHAGAFPYVPTQPAWHYAGVRFSTVNGEAFPDAQRPLTPYVPEMTIEDETHVLRCPADRGITGETTGVGTGSRTAFRSYGTSYRASAALMDASIAGLTDAHRGLRRAEITTVPSRLVLMGDPLWFEIRERTDRDAVWHGDADRANLLFLDGSVKYMQIRPRPRVGPAVFEPRVRGVDPVVETSPGS